MSKLTQQQSDFLTKHIPHRLTLLRTFKTRQNWFKSEMEMRKWHGDLLRCSKDTALISIRLFTEALGLRVKFEKQTGKHVLLDKRDVDFEDYRKRIKKAFPDTVWIDDLGGELVTTDKLASSDMERSIRMNNRADKELAHLTSTFDEASNIAKEFVLIIDLLSGLIKRYLYEKHGMNLPEVDQGISWHPAFFAEAILTPKR